MSDLDARLAQLAAERAHPDAEPTHLSIGQVDRGVRHVGYEEDCPVCAPPLECLDDPGGTSEDCFGRVELRMSLSGTGIPYPRCEHHWSKRLDREAELNQRYPVHPPSDWSPDDAGEAWSEEDY
jgi:hypothetical protein